MILMFVSTLTVDFVLSLVYPFMSCVVLYWCPESGTSCVDWAQQSRFHLKTKPEYSLRNVFIQQKQDDE
jgi:hypothetical protein